MVLGKDINMISVRVIAAFYPLTAPKVQILNAVNLDEKIIYSRVAEARRERERVRE